MQMLLFCFSIHLWISSWQGLTSGHSFGRADEFGRSLRALESGQRANFVYLVENCVEMLLLTNILVEARNSADFKPQMAQKNHRMIERIAGEYVSTSVDLRITW